MLQVPGNGACIHNKAVFHFSRVFIEWEYKTFLKDHGYSGTARICRNLKETLHFHQMSKTWTLKKAYNPIQFCRSCTEIIGTGIEKIAVVDFF